MQNGQESGVDRHIIATVPAPQTLLLTPLPPLTDLLLPIIARAPAPNTLASKKGNDQQHSVGGIKNPLVLPPLQRGLTCNPS